jgi:hypothetical protein
MKLGKLINDILLNENFIFTIKNGEVKKVTSSLDPEKVYSDWKTLFKKYYPNIVFRPPTQDGEWEVVLNGAKTELVTKKLGNTEKSQIEKKKNLSTKFMVDKGELTTEKI